MPDSNKPQWTPVFAPYWRIDCGPFFWLEIKPKPESASIDNAYQEAETIMRKAAAAEDLYTALDHLLACTDADFIIRFGSIRDHVPDEAMQDARAALLKANPQRTQEAT